MQEFALRAEDRLIQLHEALARGVWRHGQYERRTVSDPKPRIIHVASVSDRIVHHAIVRAIQPLIESSFIFDSWSCRREKGTHQAVLRCHGALTRLSDGNRPVWALHGDIRKYFASVDQEILLHMLARVAPDADARALIAEVVKSFAGGLPLGNLTSQLFANLYLNPFDHFVRERLRIPLYLRYSDDFLLSDHSAERLKMTIEPMRRFLGDRLRLVLHPRKLTIRPFHWGIDWLGYVLYPDRRTLRPRTRRRMWKRIYEVARGVMIGRMDQDTARAVFASYDGLLALATTRHDRRRLAVLRRCA